MFTPGVGASSQGTESVGSFCIALCVQTESQITSMEDHVAISLLGIHER